MQIKVFTCFCLVKEGKKERGQKKRNREKEGRERTEGKKGEMGRKGRNFYKTALRQSGKCEYRLGV